MFKYVNVQEQSTYLVHPEQRYVCVWSVSMIEIYTTSFTFHVFPVYSLLKNTEMEVASVYAIVEFSSPMVWANPFFALLVHCTIPEAAFE